MISFINEEKGEKGEETGTDVNKTMITLQFVSLKEEVVFVCLSCRLFTTETRNTIR